jgi:hypothetical protein
MDHRPIKRDTAGSDRRSRRDGRDIVTVRGRVATDMASICQVGRIFQATEVVSVT